ncbi:translocase subunit protein [Nymphaea thermarum]|nr:translocase subunit protein [Nymphaea thermarum]
MFLLPRSEPLGCLGETSAHFLASSSSSSPGFISGEHRSDFILTLLSSSSCHWILALSLMATLTPNVPRSLSSNNPKYPFFDCLCSKRKATIPTCCSSSSGMVSHSVSHSPSFPLASFKENLVGLQKNWSNFTSLNYWVVRDYFRLVDMVNALEPRIRKLTDEQLRAKTNEFRIRLSRGQTLADIQAEAFAVVREAAKRTLSMRHFDVQIIGGAVLHDGSIAEMKTGEGKTLVSTLAAYLNALTGNGVHGMPATF